MLNAPWRRFNMRAYSQDLRDRVINALEQGDRPCDIARRFVVSFVYVYNVRRRLQESGERTSRRICGHRLSCIAPLQATILGWIEAEPDLTLAQMCARLAQQFDIQLRVPSLWYHLDKWGMSFKKNAARKRTRTP